MEEKRAVASASGPHQVSSFECWNKKAVIIFFVNLLNKEFLAEKRLSRVEKFLSDALTSFKKISEPLTDKEYAIIIKGIATAKKLAAKDDATHALVTRKIIQSNALSHWQGSVDQSLDSATPQCLGDYFHAFGEINESYPAGISASEKFALMPSNAFINHWFYITEKKLSSFKVYSLALIMPACEHMSIKPSDSFMKKWNNFIGFDIRNVNDTPLRDCVDALRKLHLDIPQVLQIAYAKALQRKK